MSFHDALHVQLWDLVTGPHAGIPQDEVDPRPTAGADAHRLDREFRVLEPRIAQAITKWKRDPPYRPDPPNPPIRDQIWFCFLTRSLIGAF